MCLGNPLWRKLEEIEPAQSRHDQCRADDLTELTEPDVRRDLGALPGTFGREHTVARSMAGGIEVRSYGRTTDRPVLLDLKANPNESESEPEDADSDPSHDEGEEIRGERSRNDRARW